VRRVKSLTSHDPSNTVKVISEAVFKANHLTDTDKRNTTGKYITN